MRTFLPTLILILITFNSFAQKKSELIEQVNELSTELRTTKTTLGETQRNLNIAEAKAKSMEEQLNEVKTINESLLENLNTMITTSTERSSNIGKTLEALQLKEEQIKFINDAYSANDSIALLVLTDLKNTLGEDARISVENSAVSVLIDNSFLFGSKANNNSVGAPGKDFLGKIAASIKKYPMLAISIESTVTDNWELSTNRASAVAETLQNSYQVAPERLLALGKSGSSEAIYIHFSPKLHSFYFNVREKLKKGK